MLIALLTLPLAFAGQFLQLTDIHYDPFYYVNSDPSTGCHRFGNGTRAGRYGHRGCDTPIATLNVLFRTLNQSYVSEIPSFDFDFVVVTGDFVRHSLLDPQIPVSDDQVESAARFSFENLKSIFPNTHFLFVLGNNDPFNHDTIGGGPNSVLDFYLDLWSEYIPKASRASFHAGGYYYSDVGSGLRLVSLNTLYWFKSNVLVNDTMCKTEGAFPYEEFVWLKSVLKESKKLGMKVYLFGHVPPESTHYFKECLEEYKKIVEDYKDVIATQIFGHTNEDLFKFLKKSNDSAPYSHYLRVPSIIPVYNPALRIYNYNQENIITDYIQYFMDLDKANSGGEAKFVVEYKTKETFGLEDLTLASYVDFKERLDKDESLMKLYLKFTKVSAE